MTERSRYTVVTFGDLLAGDVIRAGAMPATITRIEPSPFPFDYEAAIADMNRRNDGKTTRSVLNGIIQDAPVKVYTAADLVDSYEWGALIADPRQVDLWVTVPGRKRERRTQAPHPIHQRLGRRVLVAVGPDAHFEVCGTCGFLWPCPHTSMMAEVRSVLDGEAAKCTYCQQRISRGAQTVTAMVVDGAGPREFRFHGRKGPCLSAALRVDPLNVAAQRADIERMSS